MMTNDFLWHKVSDEEIEEIKIQAKKIMDNFSKKLESVKVLEIKESKVVLEGERKEKEGKISDPNFRKRMFENASEKNEDFILAEKGEWK